MFCTSVLYLRGEREMKLDMKSIKKIPKMDKKELEDMIDKDSKEQGWKDA